MVEEQDQAQHYMQLCVIHPKDFDKISQANISDIGFHFMDTPEYPIIDITPTSSRKRLSIQRERFTLDNEVAITVQRQYMFLHTRFDLNNEWFLELLNEFEKDYRYILFFQYKKHKLKLSAPDDEFSKSAVDCLARYVEFKNQNKKPFSLESIYFVQISSIIE